MFQQMLSLVKTAEEVDDLPLLSELSEAAATAASWYQLHDAVFIINLSHEFISGRLSQSRSAATRRWL